MMNDRRLRVGREVWRSGKKELKHRATEESNSQTMENDFIVKCFVPVLTEMSWMCISKRGDADGLQPVSNIE